MWLGVLIGAVAGFGLLIVGLFAIQADIDRYNRNPINQAVGREAKLVFHKTALLLPVFMTLASALIGYFVDLVFS